MNKFFLLAVFLIGFTLRFYQLGINPPALTWDETAWGYNAYSMSLDGKDEFGRFLPLDYIESFGDFKPPVYAYLTILPVTFFGLNEFSTRFPSALFGSLTIIITYFLTKRILYTNTYKENIALIASCILALSPWHINLSRVAFEANVSTFFIVTGIWLFLASIQQKKWYMVGAAIFFCLSIYTFNTARIVVPLFLIVAAFITRKEILKRKKEAATAMILGLILVLPAVPFLLSPQASLRFKEVNIFTDIGVIHRTNYEIENDNNSFLSKIIHNRRLVYGVEYVRHYFDNFSPSFLFIKGDGNPKFSTQDVGQLYLWDLPFLLIGILYLFRKREGYWWVIPVMIVIAVMPAATARETPHALRIESMLPMPQILSAYGFFLILQSIRNKKYQMATQVILFTALAINAFYYLHGYYMHYSREFSGEWQYGYKQSIQYVQSVEGQYDNIFITNELGRPYIYYLFYTKTKPDFFRTNSVVKRDVFGFVTVEKYGKYHFSRYLDTSNKNALYIDIHSRVPSNAKQLKTFYLLNGEPTLTAYTF